MYQPLPILNVVTATLLGSMMVLLPSRVSATPSEMSWTLPAPTEGLSLDNTNPLKLTQSSQSPHNFQPILEIKDEQKLNVSYTKKADVSLENIQIFRNLLNNIEFQDSNETIKIYQEILPIARKRGERETELNLLIALGQAYNAVGKYKQAVQSAQDSLVLAQELHNSQAEAAAFLTLASAYQSLASTPSDYRRATMAAISSLTTSWRIKDPATEAKALTMLGSLYNSRQEKQNAIVFAEQGLKVARENNIPTVAASSLLTLSGVHLGKETYSPAIESAKEGTNILQQLQIQKPEDEAAALVMESLGYLGRGNIQKSIEFTEKSLDISRKIKSLRIEALSLIVLSLAQSHNGDFSDALETINQSRMIATELKNSDLEALILEIIGEIYRNAGQKEQAIAYYHESLSIRNSFSTLAGLSRLYQESDLIITAIAYYKQAVNKNEEQIPRIISGLPIWLQESFPQAIQNVNGLGATNVYRSFTNLLLDQKRPLEAQQVIELLKGQELREYTGNPRVYLTETGQPAALTITPIEQQLLKQYGSLTNFGYRLYECQKNRCSELRELLQQRENLVNKYYQNLAHIESEIKNKKAIDEAFVDPNLFVQKAQHLVDSQPGTLLIYPLVLDDKIWLMWASKGGIFTSVEVKGVNQTQLAETVAKFRYLLQNRLSNINELKATSKQLYDWLLKPLERELQTDKIQNLVFALDRSTRYIPMGALYDGEKYLIENYTVSTILSANLTETDSITNQSGVATSSNSGQIMANSTPLNLTTIGNTNPKIFSQNSQVNNTTILALGVSESLRGFPPLPNVPDELNAIVRLDDVETPGIYPGQEFLNQDFDFFTLRDNLSNHQILHIATHSRFVPGRANNSFLLLGTGEKLAIPDIETRLNLKQTNLVVLSACETALGGPGLDGREIAGVGYYFLKNGAKTVIATLWKVDDYSTRLLMEQFYHNLSKGTLIAPVRKAEALRQAQLSLLRGQSTEIESQQSESEATSLNDSQASDDPSINFSHPYYWAPFILMGSGS
jgi:CHAT domain-containing protein/predicted negative regulator of RcsB-dependent stress response